MDPVTSASLGSVSSSSQKRTGIPQWPKVHKNYEKFPEVLKKKNVHERKD